MPLSPELRNLRDEHGDLVYRGPAWKARRERLLARCGHKCERCRKLNQSKVLTFSDRRPEDGSPLMFWGELDGRVWYSQNGRRQPQFRVLSPLREIRAVLTMAHLTHDPLENDDADLAMLCQWCHLNYDKAQHHETRAARKDAARPLLEAIA